MKEPGAESERGTPESKTERDLFRIMTISTSLGFGALAAFLYSLKDLANDVSFVFSAGTVIAFALGATGGWAFWHGVRRVIRKD
jgi:RsiW-degrading membrane proteinase PrsW (M82 family)